MAGAGRGQQQTPSVYNQASGAYNAALGGTAASAMGPNIAQFQNPYTAGVVDTSLDALNRARQMTMNDVGAAATRAGAFGGSRQGVAEAETNRAFFDQAGQLAGNLNMQGFNTALNAAQNQQQIGLQGAAQLGNLSQQGFNYGQAITGQQQQQGNQQQATLQALLDAAQGQFRGFTGSPNDALATRTGILGAIPGGGGQTSTTSQRPGLFNYLSLALGL